MKATTIVGVLAATSLTVLPAQAAAHAAGGAFALTEFRSPSGNIGCVVLDGSARCDVGTRSWTPPSPPASCDTHMVAFGQGVAVDATGPGHLVCAGDTARDPAAPVLPYGASDNTGGFRCDSSTAGMSCVNLATGHGFFISADRYSVH
jgi:hypothetical protein